MATRCARGEVSQAVWRVTAGDERELPTPHDKVLGLIGRTARQDDDLDLISGFVPADDGRVYLDGVDVTGAPYRRAARGLGRSFQDARLWGALTVREAMAASLARTVEITSHWPLPSLAVG